MAACPACGKELPGEFPFCPYCTAPLTGESREQRKTVTVLFCDVTGPTALGETTDPEALRALLARYFERRENSESVQPRSACLRACAEGRAMSLDAAADYALS